MRPVVSFSLRQTVLFNLVFVLLIVAGAFSLATLPVERYPQVNFGKVIVSTFYPGASPGDVESLVTQKIEEALDGLEDVEFMQSTSARQYSGIMVKFHDDVDYDKRYDELRFRVLSMLGELPDAVKPPSFTLIKTSSWIPVLAINLVGERSNRALALMAKELQVELEQVDGVQEVRLDGEYQREFHVYLDPVRMNALGVSFEDVAAALQSTNISLPAGEYQDASGLYLVKVDEKFQNAEQVRQTVVRRDLDGSFVRVGEVATEVGLGYRDPQVMTTVNGTDCVTLKVLKTDGGSALKINEQVQRIVGAAEASLGQQGVEVVITRDSTTYIDESISTLGWNMLLGIGLVSLILWYFMGLRNAAITTVGIPFSFLFTMVLMKISGNSLNEITLFSFVLVSGNIVDDAIVVIENIYRHVQEGRPLHQAIVEGTSEVMIPVISATATTVAAFLPMLLMTGSTGEFFALIPKAVSFAIVASLIECLFILPIHYQDFGPRPGSAPDAERDNGLMKLLRRGTDKLVAVTLRFRLTSMLSVLLAFFAAISIFGLSISGLAPLVPVKFFPDDYNLYYAFVEGPADAPVDVTAEKTREMARYIMADGAGYARSAAGYAGFTIGEDYEQEFGQNLGTVMVALPARGQRAFADVEQHLQKMRARLVETFGSAEYKITLRAEKDGPPAGKDVNLRVVGSNEDSVSRLAADLLAGLQATEPFASQLVQLQDNRGRTARVFRLKVDQLRAQEYGLTTLAAAQLAASVLDGRYIGKYRVADEEIDIKLRVDPAYLDNPEAALQVPVLEQPAGPVYLGDIVQPVAAPEPGKLHRYQKQRSISITANIKPGVALSSAGVVTWARNYYEQHRDRYLGANLIFGGEFAETRRSYTSLTQAFGLALLLIYLILATQFRSYVQPLFILSAVVFSIIGVVFGKLVTQSLFTINSFIAVVGVTGVVVNDSLVLLDFINRGYRAGLGRRKAILQGIRIRLRPIVLTTLTTTLGLLPMALGIPSYSLVWGTMASTFVTGLATATFLTLFIVPVQWDLLMGLKERRERRRAEAAAKVQPAR